MELDKRKNNEESFVYMKQKQIKHRNKYAALDMKFKQEEIRAQDLEAELKIKSAKLDLLESQNNELESELERIQNNTSL